MKKIKNGSKSHIAAIIGVSLVVYTATRFVGNAFAKVGVKFLDKIVEKPGVIKVKSVDEANRDFE